MSSDRAFRTERSAVPPHRAAEQRNTVAPAGTEHRNSSGTTSLLALVDKVLSRARSGTPTGTTAEQSVPHPPERRVSYPQPPEGCPHVEDPDLAEWFAEHPEVVCARCFLDGRPLPSWDLSVARRLVADMLNRCEAAYAENPHPGVFDDESVGTAERRIDSASRARDWHRLLRALRVYERAFVKALGEARDADSPRPAGTPRIPRPAP